MSIRFTRRAAAELLHKGEHAIRIKPASIEEAKRAITRDDVRRLIKDGIVYAEKKKTVSAPRPEKQQQPSTAAPAKSDDTKQTKTV